ncbi:AI-2E family transporter [Hahella aquimaris]|uniref:AI-2E family transporter n=1 Tax=Hahella sp. HNIBRBA332 TaxID=3015983 RepID=UPI00273BC57A|nr:AI-2E family transporter [Hahella sp. HNIBRBA332]WLQ12252.1 AI-2E family transporter [Hahella sp. HNIBRBA332]
MSQQAGFTAGARFLITLAAFIIVVAGVKQAESIVSVFLLSAFFAILCTPPFVFLQSKGVPAWLSLILVLVGITCAQLLVVSVIASSLADFKENLDFYQERLQGVSGEFINWLNSMGIHISQEVVKNYFNPGSLLKTAANMLGGLGGVLSNAFLIVLTVIFMVFEATVLPNKLHRAFEGRMAFERLDLFLDNVKRHMSIKTIISLVTGLTVWIMLLGLGVDYALLWALLALLFNFIPNIGSIIAAIPAVLLALIQLGPGHAAIAGAGYVVINVVMGNIIEPKFMGRGLGLSTLVVFLSLVFWGWVLGPVGMLLSVPLTMMLKIALDSSEETRWMSILMGSEIEGD